MSADPTTYPRDWCHRLSAGVEALGIRFEDHLAALGLDPGQTHFRRREVILLLVANVALTGDEGLGLLSRPTPMGSFALRIGTMMTCQTLGSALAVCHSFTRVSRLPIRIHFDRSPDEARIAIRLEGPEPDQVATAEDMFASVVFGILAWLVGRDLPLLQVTTRLANSPFIGRSHPILRAPVMAGQATTMILPETCLDWPIMARPTLSPIWDATQWFAGAVLSPGSPSRAEAVMAPYPDPDPGAEDGRRRLFPARDLIATTDLAFSDIARRLGFSDLHAFRRFMRAQTGLTPTALRRAARQAPALPLSDLARRVQSALSSMDLASVQTREAP